MIAITICSTRSYAYAMIAQARKIAACIEREPQGIVILVGDDSPEIQQAKEFYESVLPEKTTNHYRAGAAVPKGSHQEGWRLKLIIGKFEDGLPNYKNAAQLTIARMRSIAFDWARKENVDLCWSLDSDVLPPPNALRVMKQMLEFDDGYYAVSTCPYPSQGGGAFLGGRGTPEAPILPDFYDDERIIPRDLRKRMNAHKTRLRVLNGKPDEEWLKKRETLSEEIKKCQPIGNVFFCNSKKFRRRGWMDAAYPGLGIGAIVPSDWCGFGCTLMNKRALSLAQFDGYDGSGTEDLYVVWKRWHRNGLRINAIPHTPCDHVIRDPKNEGKFILCQAFHEYRDPECVGHLRIEPRPWYQQTEGEQYNGPKRD
jgi:hypothetical protein